MLIATRPSFQRPWKSRLTKPKQKSTLPPCDRSGWLLFFSCMHLRATLCALEQPSREETAEGMSCSCRIERRTGAPHHQPMDSKRVWLCLTLPPNSVFSFSIVSSLTFPLPVSAQTICQGLRWERKSAVVLRRTTSGVTRSTAQQHRAPRLRTRPPPPQLLPRAPRTAPFTSKARWWREKDTTRVRKRTLKGSQTPPAHRCAASTASTTGTSVLHSCTVQKIGCANCCGQTPRSNRTPTRSGTCGIAPFSAPPQQPLRRRLICRQDQL